MPEAQVDEPRAAAAALVGQTAAAPLVGAVAVRRGRWGNGLEEAADELERRGQDPAEPRQDVDQQRPPPGAHGCDRRRAPTGAGGHQLTLW